MRCPASTGPMRAAGHKVGGENLPTFSPTGLPGALWIVGPAARARKVAPILAALGMKRLLPPSGFSIFDDRGRH